MRYLQLLTVILILTGCDTDNQGAQTFVDSEKSDVIETENGVSIIGKWLWKHSAETTFTISYEDSLYHILVEYNPKFYSDRFEVLDKKGARYNIRNSPTSEYYLIGQDGNLEVGDNQGVFAVAKRLPHK